MKTFWRNLILLWAFVVSSCAGGMGTTEKGDDGEVLQGEIELQDQLSAPVPGMEQGAGPGAELVPLPLTGTDPASPVSAFGQGSSLAPGLEAPTGPTAATTPTGQIFGIPITAGEGAGSATPNDVTANEEEGDGSSNSNTEISYHYSTAAPGEAPGIVVPPTAPSVTPDPIVVCAPDTMCYDTKPFGPDLGCSYDKMKDKEVGIKITKISPSKSIVIVGKMETGGGKEIHRQCTIEISQQGEEIRNVGTNPQGFFGLAIRNYETETANRDGEEVTITIFELQIYSTDEEPVALGEPTVVEVELPIFRRDIIKEVPTKNLPRPLVIETKGPSKKPATDKKKDQKKPVIVPLKTPSSSSPTLNSGKQPR